MSNTKKLSLFFTLFLGFSWLTACNRQSEKIVNPGKLQIVATTTIVGDVVKQVGGDFIDLEVLLPVGADPHSFDPTPQDVAKISNADLVFANGAGLEAFLEKIIDSANAEDKLVYVSEGVDFLMFESTDNSEKVGEEFNHNDEVHDDENAQNDQDHDDEGEERHHHEGMDPHTWTDPNNVLVWVQNITQVLIEKDQVNSIFYESNAEKFTLELEALDSWIRAQVALIPSENRKLVTDHTLFSYFADEYGFEQVGAIILGFSTLSEATAQDLAEIEDVIRSLHVKAVFVGNSVNPSLAERVASDTGVQLVYVYTGSLSDADGEAGSYLAYMRYNTNAFINALK